MSRKTTELAFGFLENMRYRSQRNFIVQGGGERRPEKSQKSEGEREIAERIKKLSQSAGHDETSRDQLRKAYSEYEKITLKAQLAGPQYKAIRSVAPAGLAEIQNKLAADTAIVQYLFAGEKVTALIVTTTDLQAVQLTISKSDLDAKIKLLRSLVFQDEVGETTWLPVAESLRANLIEPVERQGALKNIKRIGIGPYGYLNNTAIFSTGTPRG